MTHSQISRALSGLSSLACSLEDLQVFSEGGQTDEVNLSLDLCRQNIAIIREALVSIEGTIGLEAEVHALPVRVPDDWDTAA